VTREEVSRVVDSNRNVSDKIRVLAAAGMPRADIARALGKRYQHVRNVLEGDRLHTPPSKDYTPAGVDKERPAGVAEAGKSFSGSHRLSVEAGGMVRLPPDLLAGLQAGPGSVIIAEVQEDGIKLFSNTAAWARVAAMAQAIGFDPKRDMVAELLAERRAEVARDG
jgi:predicted transcriptional regulator